MKTFKAGKVFLCLAVALAVMASFLAAPPAAYSQTAQPMVLGKTIGQWSAEWWKWVLAIPADTNPMMDNTGEFGDINQQGPAWFLAGVWNGTTATRTVTVPAGKSIFFPIFNLIWTQTPYDPGEWGEDEWRPIIMDAIDFVQPLNLICTLDGAPVVYNHKTPIIRTQSPVFTVAFPEYNVWDVYFELPAGSYPNVSDGYWVMLPPLSPGAHTLHFAAGPTGSEVQNVTYNLTVTPAAK